MAKAKHDRKSDTEVEVKGPASAGAASKADQPSASALQPWDFEREFDRAIGNLFSRGWLKLPQWDFPSAGMFSGDRTPKVNVIDRENEVVIEAELAGVDKDDIDVSLSDNSVTIKASSRKEEAEEKGDYHRREISSGQYVRTLPLSADIDRDKVSARFQDGMLTLTLPKSEQSKPQTIKVD